MIEIVYSEDESKMEKEISIDLPKNIRQIGDEESNKKIYIEDTVYSFIRQRPLREETIRYGVLLGEIRYGNGNAYIFANGAIEVKNATSLEFTDDIWTSIYEEIRRYFENRAIVGWYVSMPYNVRNQVIQIQKIHLDNFAGNDKICFYLDRQEREEGFYLYENKGLSKQSTYYMYYEKNTEMLQYVDTMEEIAEEPEMPAEQTYGTFRAKLKDAQWDKNKVKKKLPVFAQSASSFLIIVLLIAIIAMMNQYGDTQDVQGTIDNLAENLKKAGDDLQVEEVAGGVYPTTEEKSKQNPKETKEKKTEQNSEATKATEKETTKKEPEETESATEAVETVYETYTVLAGETLSDISTKIYNTIGKVEEIKQLNELDNEDIIYEGQVLKLP